MRSRDASKSHSQYSSLVNQSSGSIQLVIWGVDPRNPAELIDSNQVGRKATQRLGMLGPHLKRSALQAAHSSYDRLRVPCREKYCSHLLLGSALDSFRVFVLRLTYLVTLIIGAFTRILDQFSPTASSEHCSESYVFRW